MEAAKTLDMLQPRFIGNSTLTPKLFMKWKKTRLPFHFSTIRVSNCSFRLGPNPYGDLPEFRRENTAVDKKSLLQWSPTGRKIVESLEVKLSDDKKREHILISLADLDAEETAITIHRGLEETGRKEKPKIKFQRSFSLTSLRGGRVAWERMQFAQEAIHDPKILADSKERFKKLLGQANPDMKQLQKEVSILEMSGEEDEAIEMLQEAMQRAKEDKKKEGPDLQLAHDLEMLVVEMLIYQGNYDAALNCKCLEEVAISDARRPLYMAIVKLVKGDYDPARESWQEFKEMMLDEEFQEFEDSVKSLELQINHARKEKM